ASAAIAVSDIPFNGPISEVRVAKVDGQLVVNPTLTALQNATLEYIVAGSAQDIVMVEGESKEISEAEMVEAIAFAHEAIKKQVAAQIELANLVGATAKRDFNHEPSNLELRDAIFAATYDQVYAVAKSGSTKQERTEKFAEIGEAFFATLGEEIDDETAFLT